MITFQDIRQDEAILAYIQQADTTLKALGFTEHALPHLDRCAQGVKWLLEALGYDDHTVKLAQIAAFLHDIGNMINRSDHAHSGAIMVFTMLQQRGMPPEDIARIVTAIGHHDERTAHTIDEITCALIIADKCDVRRSRVRDFDPNTPDIHDRVNYAVEKADLILSDNHDYLALQLKVDTQISTVAEYFEIFLQRMLLCRDAAGYFDMTFKLVINDTEIF